MRKTRRFNSREKQIFLVGFSLTSPRFLQISKNRLNTSLGFLGKCNLSERFFFFQVLLQRWQVDWPYWVFIEWCLIALFGESDSFSNNLKGSTAVL